MASLLKRYIERIEKYCSEVDISPDTSLEGAISALRDVNQRLADAAANGNEIAREYLTNETKRLLGSRMGEVYAGAQADELLDQYAYTDGMQAHADCLWARWGYPTFRLSENLATQLLLTDPPQDEDIGEAAWPFPGFALSLPTSIIPAVEWNDRFGDNLTVHPHIVTMSRFPTPDVGKPIFNDDGEQVFDEVVMGKVIGGCVSDVLIILKNSHLKGGKVVMGLVHLFMHWLADNPHDCVQVPTSKKAAKSGKTRAKVYECGRAVELNSRVVKTLKQGKADGTPLHKIREQMTVRGHTKNQPCGKQWKERKRIWVKPYIRGPQDSPMKQRIYNCDV